MSAIEWTDQTWNPWVGCTEVGRNGPCFYCYAAKIAHRFNHPHYEGLTQVCPTSVRVEWTGRINRAPPHIFTKPTRMKKPTVFFVNSMSDMFHHNVDDKWLIDAFQVMNSCPQHTFQVLTKRPARMASKTRQLSLDWGANIWAGTSIGEDKYARGFVDSLMEVPAKLRFVSAEPLLEALPNLQIEKLDWLIVGGESGNERGIRAMGRSWVRDLLTRSRESGTPFFFKQWGAWGEDGIRRSKGENGHLLDGHEIFEMPADAYDRLKAYGRAPDPRWTRIPKRAFLRPADRLTASPVPYVVQGRASGSDDDYVLSLMRGDRNTYENPQRTKKLVSEADKERWETEARWRALLGEFGEFGE